ncbi:glycosyltransferase [Fibrobacter sp. UWH1]|uniref:glycosyltransferase n=1 Tax=Fibrobacter sp. UWH1 TaxID=1964354 RepID=UPI000B52067A|nr:glycosyltransferase [Fibrobacter sp. UWH1]OWV12143.1 hypothetical protein B7992_09760 [Fibrobacter sp. UWH1]
MVKQTEMVSVIMPSYNTGKYVADSIRSVLAQTYTNWELIIVDDCSSDDSLDVIDSLCHPERSVAESIYETRNFSSLVELGSKEQDLASRIRIFVNEKNSGAAVSRNKAVLHNCLGANS